MREIDGAFKALFKSLCDCVLLNVPVYNDVFVMYTDTSVSDIGSYLHVIRGTEELRVTFVLIR